MAMLRTWLAVLITLIASLMSISAAAQQPFLLSSEFVEATFSGKQRPWDGRHSFGNVFCLNFPRPSEADSLAFAFYNKNTLYFSRAVYSDKTAIYVVTSTVPAGRTVEAEINNIAALNQKAVEAYPGNFSQSKTTGLLGPSLVMTVRNATEGKKDAPFPFVRPIAQRPDGALTSVSAHRFFVRGLDRIEVAGLRYFKTPVVAEREAQEISDLSALVEEAAESLQSCSSKLPPKN